MHEKQIANILNAVYLHGKSGGMERPIVEGAMTIQEGIVALASTYEKPDLSLTEVDELIREVFDRYENAVIGLERVDKVDKKLGDYKIRWKGSPFIGLGLTDFIKDDIRDYRRHEGTDPLSE